MAKFLNLGRMNLEPEDPSGGPSSTGGVVARPTGMPIPPQYANVAQTASTNQFMPVSQMQPIDQPSSPTTPPTPTPDSPDPGLTCPAGTLFDPATSRCIPQYPTPTTPTQQPGQPTYPYPVPPEAATQPGANVPPGYFTLLGRAYPKWWLWAAGGSLGFGSLLLVILASKRRRRAGVAGY